MKESWLRKIGIACLYGLLDLAEQVQMHGLAGVQEKTCAPRFPFRAIKFNLPWMSYRKHESLQLHMEPGDVLTGVSYSMRKYDHIGLPKAH